MDPRTDVVDIAISREDATVTITFGDGAEGRFDLVEMRVHCPCAGCRGAREQGRVPWPPPGGDPTITIADAELVGAYGLGVTWSDGHTAGIYPWEAMRRWHDSGEAGFTADSGRGG
jgi:ATP-binding protein involved in chromosome partitioning